MKTIRLFATLRDLTGAKEIEIPFRDGQTVRELVSSIQAVSPVLGDQILTPQGELTGLVHIFVEGRNVVWLNGLDTVVRDTDALVLMPPAAGG